VAVVVAVVQLVEITDKQEVQEAVQLLLMAQEEYLQHQVVQLPLQVKEMRAVQTVVLQARHIQPVAVAVQEPQGLMLQMELAVATAVME
jgi:hypothetical protein